VITFEPIWAVLKSGRLDPAVVSEARDFARRRGYNDCTRIALVATMPNAKLIETLCRLVAMPHRLAGATVRVKLVLRLIGTVAVILTAFCLGFFPAVTTARVAFSSSMRQHGRIDFLASWFRATQRRHDRWMQDYGKTQRAASIASGDVAATEWPMFGSAFFILSAEGLLESGEIALTDDLRKTLRDTALLIANPTTGTWVQRKWGSTYLEKEDVFYRMLLILGLGTYQKVTGDRQFAPTVLDQARGLSRELETAPYHLLDDYPGECYPTDVLWAALAITRVTELPKGEREHLAQSVTTALAERFSDAQGLPAMRVDSRTGQILQAARGCSTSGILCFAYELAPEVASDWFGRYLRYNWLDNGWIAGFREHPIGAKEGFSDVDSGPILFGVGTVASVFGIGAARAAGRFDIAARLTMEAVAAAWPTPFGLLVPGIMGWVAADGWSLGETAFLFALTRPNYRTSEVSLTARPPFVVYAFIAIYSALGIVLVAREWAWWRRRSKATLSPNASTSLGREMRSARRPRE
jgi:hypothetical protein